jgi:hypothetical protein
VYQLPHVVEVTIRPPQLPQSSTRRSEIAVSAGSAALTGIASIANATTKITAKICLTFMFVPPSYLHLYMNSPFIYKGKFIEGYTAITVLLPDMISKRLVDLIIIEFQIKSSKITLNDKRAS